MEKELESRDTFPSNGMPLAGGVRETPLPPPPVAPSAPLRPVGPRGWRKFFAIVGLVFLFPFLLTIPFWFGLAAYNKWKSGERDEPRGLIAWGVIASLLFSLTLVATLVGGGADSSNAQTGATAPPAVAPVACVNGPGAAAATGLVKVRSRLAENKLLDASTLSPTGAIEFHNVVGVISVVRGIAGALRRAAGYFTLADPAVKEALLKAAVAEDARVLALQRKDVHAYFRATHRVRVALGQVLTAAHASTAPAC